MLRFQGEKILVFFFLERHLDVGCFREKSDRRRWFCFGNPPSLVPQLSWTAGGLIGCGSDYSLQALSLELTLQTPEGGLALQ